MAEKRKAARAAKATAPALTRAAVVAEARSWLGTPFAHQQALKGVGVDCAQLVIATAQALGYAGDLKVGGYGQNPDPALLIGTLGARMEEINPLEALPGDVLLLRWDANPSHLAMVTEATGRGYEGMVMLHCRADSGVVEHHVGRAWLRRVCAAYRFRGIR